MDFRDGQTITVQCTDGVLKVPLDVMARLGFYCYDLFPPGSILPLNFSMDVMNTIFNIEIAPFYHDLYPQLASMLAENEHQLDIYVGWLRSLGSAWLADPTRHSVILAAAHFCSAYRTLAVIRCLVFKHQFKIDLLLEPQYRDQLPDLVAEALHFSTTRDVELIHDIVGELDAHDLSAAWKDGVKLAVEIEVYSDELSLDNTHAADAISLTVPGEIKSELTPSFALKPYQLLDLQVLDNLATSVAEYEVVLRHPTNSDHRITITPDRVEFKSELDRILLSKYFQPQSPEALATKKLEVRTNQFKHVLKLVNYWGTFTVDIDVTHPANIRYTVEGVVDYRFGVPVYYNEIYSGISRYIFEHPITGAPFERIVSLHKAVNTDIVYPRPHPDAIDDDSDEGYEEDEEDDEE